MTCSNANVFLCFVSIAIISTIMSAVDISQEQAQWLFTEGAILVFLDLPAGSEFGVDYCSWEVGERFKGVKMIPPGIHFIYYRFVSKRFIIILRSCKVL